MSALPPVNVAPSRWGKKQIMAYLEPKMVDAARAMQEREDLTVQEILAMSINKAYEAYGRHPIIEVGRNRRVRRKSRRAKTLKSSEVPDCRAGHVRFGGWFDEKIHTAVTQFAGEVGTKVPNLILLGFKLLLKEGPKKKVAA